MEAQLETQAAGAPKSLVAGETSATQPGEAAQRVQRIFLVRHGQTTYNVEGRLPGQLPGVALTDEGRRQAQQAAVALSALPLSRVVASPLERARETAEIIARGWALPVQQDARLMDTDVGLWAGQKIDEIAKADPNWKAFVEHPNEPPAGVESLGDVQRRAVAVIEELRADQTVGDHVVVVAHADVVKLIVAHYQGVAVECVRFMAIGNASISALAFVGQERATILGVNWSAMPAWLAPPRTQTQQTPPAPATDSTKTDERPPAGS